MNVRLLTPVEQDEVVAKYESGMTMTAIADEYGCHYTTVGRLLRARKAVIREN
jgi:DNA-directed RNA polymerase specialized sigma24 family protein